MSILIAVILGVIQGLTEFIPISSTAHLTIAASVMGVINPSHPEQWTAFMATIQLGTLGAVIAYFRRDLVSMTTHFFRENVGKGRVAFKEQSRDSRMAWLVVIGTLPVVIVGLLLKDVIEGSITKDLRVIAISLIGVGALLWFAERKAKLNRTSSDLNVTDALVVGGAQILALVPGSSRSGSTIMAALFRGITREHAARFSFLLSIPAILGAGLLEFIGEFEHLNIAEYGVALLISTLAAAVSGYWSIAFLLRYLRSHSMNIFIAYRLALGVVILLTACSPQSESVSEQVASEMKAPPAKTDVVSDTSTSVLPDTALVTSVVEMRTSEGVIKVGLYGEDAPLTTKNFLDLVKRRYYDRVLFHRVSKGFVIQAGDPRTRDANARAEWGRGGETASGKPLPEELNPATPSYRTGYGLGIVAMARTTEPNSGTSQFFICLDNATSLPHQYTIFGRVIDGLDVVKKIGMSDVEPGQLGETDGIPKKPIVIHSMRNK